MATVTKKDLIERIAEQQDLKRVLAKRIIQAFLDTIVEELSKGNRIEFRDFGVFEAKLRPSRKAQNPKTMTKVDVPSRRAVKFKPGSVLRRRLDAAPVTFDEATGLALEPAANPYRDQPQTNADTQDDMEDEAQSDTSEISR